MNHKRTKEHKKTQVYLKYMGRSAHYDVLYVASMSAQAHPYHIQARAVKSAQVRVPKPKYGEAVKNGPRISEP